MAIIQSISAGLTDLGREFRVRGETEGLVIGDWSFQVGTDGFELLNPDIATDVDFTSQVLSAPVGGTRYLGRVVTSGPAATTTLLGDGQVQVDNLAAIPAAIANRWIRLSGSADPLVNGTWVISQYLSATSVVIHNPLMTSADPGPLAWELRESCVMHPNVRSVDFHGRLLAPDATIDGQEIGQVGVFGRVVEAPTLPSLLGTVFLFAVAHHPAIAKFEEMTANYHVCVQS